MARITQPILAEEVLDKAMHLFWEKGFFNVSIDDLVNVTGFNRAAIYKHFGGKEGLFIAMLKRYREQITDNLISPLKNQAATLNAIETFFLQFMPSKDQNPPCGCFLVATASDVPSHNQEILAFIQDFLNQLRYLFQERIKNAQSNGELKPHTNSQSVADFLVGNSFGLMTLYRAFAPREVIENQIKQTIQFLTLLTESKDAT